MHYLFQVNIYLYYQKGKICVQCLVYSPCCLLLFLWIMDNMPVGIISAVYLSIFQHSGIFIFLCRSFGICTCLVNICLICFPFFFFVPLLQPANNWGDLSQGNKTNKWKKIPRNSFTTLLFLSELLIQHQWNYTRLSYSIIASCICINTDSDKLYLQTSYHRLQQD